MQRLLKAAELGFTILCLMFYSGGPLTVVASGGVSEGDASTGESQLAAVRMVFLVTYIITIGLLLPRWQKALYLLVKEKFVLLLTGLVLSSIFWSFLPSLTVQRSIALAGTTLFGLYLATRYSLNQQLKLLAATLGLIILLSFLFAVLLPQYGLMGGTHAGAWRGIYTHKNVLGKIMVLSSSVFWLLATSARKNNLLYWTGFGLSVLLLLLARSTSSLLSCMVIVALMTAFHLLKWRGKVAIPIVLFGLFVIEIASLLLLLNLEEFFSIFGKDASLTGRSDLWPAVLTMIGKHPWLGYGYSGFWRDLNSEGGYVWRATGWMPPNAHNGILDLLLDTGLVGLFIFLTGYIKVIFSGVQRMRLHTTLEGNWVLLYATFLFLVNMTESSLLIQNNIFWAFYVAIALSLFTRSESSQISV